MAHWQYKFYFRACDRDQYHGTYDMTEWIDSDEHVETYADQEALVSQWCLAHDLAYVNGSAVFQGAGVVGE